MPSRCPRRAGRRAPRGPAVRATTRARPRPAPRFIVQFVNHGQRKGCRFARSCLGTSEHVDTVENLGNCFRLDRRWGFIPQGFQGASHRLCQPQIFKFQVWKKILPHKTVCGTRFGPGSLLQAVHLVRAGHEKARCRSDIFPATLRRYKIFQQVHGLRSART